MKKNKKIKKKVFDKEKKITSRVKGLYKKREKIIFPYDYKNGKLIRYSTQQFNTQFPGAVNYLCILLNIPADVSTVY